MSAPKYPISCPTCFAAPNMPCRSRSANKVTDTHRARIEAYAISYERGWVK